MISTEERLKAFQEENNIYTKGPLSLVVQFTRLVQNKDFPLNPDDFQTSSKGQVAGLGGGNLKKILKEHGITQQLSAEGGRTSRGSMGLMIKYVDFLNAWNEEETVDFSIVEEFWAEQVREYFRNQPFVLTADTSKTIGANLDELFEQAKKRQKQNPGTQYLGTVLQHLVAAKLCLIMPENAFEIHGASVADAPTERSGDFVINNTIIHCTTMPGALLIEKCKANLRGGCHPVIITIFERVHTALNLAEDAGLAGRVEVWDIQQFLSSNVYEHSLFDESKRNSTLSDIIGRYNEIVLEAETDPSLRIEFEARRFIMADIFNNEKRSEIMRKVKLKKNKSTELRLIDIFKQNGITGWKRNYPVKGHPDFVFLKEKVAVFVDGCFWHGHDCRNTRPAENKEYWQKKCERNMKHDKDVTAMFEARGWKVLRIWECELKKRNETILVEKIQSILSRSSERTQR